MAPRVAAGETVAIVFGRERNGLENHEVALADRIVTLPVNPAFASLNLAQAVVIVGYEWFKRAGGGELPFAMPEKSPPAAKQQLDAFFADLERELEKVEFFRPGGKARHHEREPAQYLPAHGADRSRTSARCTASSRRSRKGAKGRRAAACSMAPGAEAARFAGRAWRRPRAVRTHAAARPAAAAAAQSDRRRAHACGRRW